MKKNRHSYWITERVLIATLSGLALWVVHLAFNLPESYRAQNWDLAWVGFDLFMFVTLAITTWGIWRQRQIAIFGSIVSATLLVIDSWFDMATSQDGFDFRGAIIAAVVFQIPIAIALIRFARREIHQQIRTIRGRLGIEITRVSLIRTPLGILPKEGLPD